MGKAKGLITKVFVFEFCFRTGPCACRQTCASKARDVHGVCFGLRGLFGVGSYPGSQKSRYPMFLGCH